MKEWMIPDPTEEDYKDSLIRNFEQCAMRCIQNNLEDIWRDATRFCFDDYGCRDHLLDWNEEVGDEIFDQRLQNFLQMKLSLTPIKK